MVLKDLFKKLANRTSSPGRRTSASAEDRPGGDIQSTASSTRTDPAIKARTGLFLLNVPLVSDDIALNIHPVDIVFIHGLNGHYMRTWTHHNGTCWPKDLLPQALPAARIYSYGYPSQIFASRSVAGIRDFAKQLLSCLDLERAEDKHFRPIIYVCHSLGGIVLKQALTLAYQLEEFRDIWLGSKAVIFMGTPHRGSPDASFGKILGDVANLALHVSGTHRLTGGINRSLIETLGQESKELLAIAEDFVSRASALRIVTYYETKTHPLTNKVIVGQSSAVLGLANERSRPLYLNHQELCRFSGIDDKDYQQVSRLIISVAKEILQENKAVASSLSTDHSYDETEKICASLLNTVDVACYESRLDIRVEGTLDWVLVNPQYINWVSNASARILWVTGYVGCGKTTLASFIMRYLTDHLPRQALVCRFFCDNKIEELRDPSSLLRSLIFQIVNGRRRLWRFVKKASDAGGLHIFRQFDALWNLFVQMTRIENKSPITIIIDAIDECDKKAQLLVVSRISELLRLADTTVKFFITSRPNAEAVLDVQVSAAQLTQLPLEDKKDQIEGDIRFVVRHRLDRMVTRGTCRPSVRDVLEHLLIAKADQTFLWIKLVLPLLEDRRVLLLSDVDSIAAMLPSDLASLYRHLLLSIPEADQAVAARMLRLLVACDRPLTGEEIGIMMTIGPDHRSMASLATDQLLFNKDSVRAALGSLVRLHGSTIELVHQSLKEYLINLSNGVQDALAVTFGIDLIRDKLQIFATCSLYLSLEELQQNIQALVSSCDNSSTSSEAIIPSPHSSSYGFNLYEEPMFKEDPLVDEAAWASITTEYKLFDYAALHWATDFSICNAAATEQHHSAARALCRANTAQLENWFYYFWFRKMYPEPFPPAVNGLMVTSYFGHSDTLLRLLSDPESQDSGSLAQALYWAARQGQSSCVGVLQQQPQYDPQISAKSQIPLSAAAQFGHLECVTLLLEDARLDINAQDSHGRTALSLTASNNHAEIASLLLAHNKIDVDLPDNSLNTPLHWAVAAGSYSIVSQILTDSRAQSEHLDKRGRNVLSWAAEYGATDIVTLLLHSLVISADQKDPQGRTPLSYASQHGHLPVVKQLVESKLINPLDQDYNGRNAHSWAATQRQSSVLRYLIRKCRQGADVPDRDGWTPLSWALDPPGYVENMLLLLRLGCVDVNRKDGIHGRTFLSWVASYGYTQVARQVVLLKDVEIESRDVNGRTPLSEATASGSVEIVRLLIETGKVDVNSRDKHGRTPLSWAVIEGHGEVVQLLLSIAAVDRKSRDSAGRTALDVARVFEREDIVSILQEWGVA